MRHQAQDVALAIAHTSDICQGSVRIGRRLLASIWSRIAKCDLVIALEVRERRAVAKIISVAVRDRNFQHLAGLCSRGERRVPRFHSNVYLAAHEPHAGVSLQHTRQEARLAQNLETVANAEDKSAAVRELFDRAHNRREARDRARAQIVAVRKTAGQEDRVKAAYLFGLMPEKFNRLVKNLAERVPCIVVAVRARKHDHADFHRECSPPDIWILP